MSDGTSQENILHEVGALRVFDINFCSPSQVVDIDVQSYFCHRGSGNCRIVEL